MLAARTCVEYPEHAVLDALRPPLSSSTWRESVEYVYNNQRTCVNRIQTIHRITA